MRYQTIFLTALCLGGFSASFAAEPGTPATPAQPTMPAATAATGDTNKAAADAALAAQTHRLRSASYKPRVKNGVTVWCRQETALGSRLAQVESCGSPEEIDQAAQSAKDTVEKMQRNTTQHQSN